MGSGTTLIEAKLLNRNAVGLDINPKAIALANSNLEFLCKTNSKIYTKQGNACDLSCLKSESFDLVCMHPPYANIIEYSDNLADDISLLSLEPFLEKMQLVSKEAYRVLRHGKICAYMIGDIRKKENVIPLGFKTMELFLSIGFSLKEIILKEQHNCRSTDYWINKERKFLLLAHEYIFVFEK